MVRQGSLKLLLVLLLVSNGCGGSSDGDAQQAGDDAASTDIRSLDGTDEDPGTSPEQGPVALELVFDPELQNYTIGETITVSAVGFNAAGDEVVVGALGPLKLTPGSVAETGDESTFKFVGEGNVLVASCLLELPDLCANRTAVSDATGPIIMITTPARGAMLTGEQVVLVSGQVVDELGEVAEAQLNGETLALGSDGSFGAPMNVVHGLNIVDVTAADTFGNESRSTRSFLFSNEYLPDGAGQLDLALVNHGLLAYLDDLLFYNPDQSAPDNLTYLFEVILADLDIGALLPNPVVTGQDLSVLCLWGKYDFYIENITYGQPDVKLEPVAGGVKLHITIPNFSGDFAIVTDAFGCADFSGSITANALLAQAMIEISASQTGDLIVNVSQTDVLFDNLQIKLGGIPGTLLNWLIDLFQGTVANLLQDEFKKQVEGMVGGLTETLAETLGAPIEIPLDGFVPGNDPVLLRLAMRFDKAYFTTAGADLDVRLSITADNAIGIETPGSLGRGQCLGTDDTDFAFDLAAPAPLELAGHIDLVNQALYSLWANGGLHLHVTSEALAEMGTDVGKYGVADLILDTGPLLPPAITSCNADNKLTAQIGDFYVEAKLSMLGVPADLDMYLFLALEADLAVVEGDAGPEIALAIEQPQYVIVDIVSVNEEWKGKEAMLISLLTDTMIPKLLESFQDKPISFALPTINLGGLLPNQGPEPQEPGSLDGKELAIDLQQLTHTGSYVHVQGGIKIQDVPPPPEEEVP
mgnify:CR=1 FL=1